MLQELEQLKAEIETGTELQSQKDSLTKKLQVQQRQQYHYELFTIYVFIYFIMLDF